MGIKNIEDYPTPQYVADAWHDLIYNFNGDTMRAWETACALARREFEAQKDS